MGETLSVLLDGATARSVVGSVVDPASLGFRLLPGDTCIYSGNLSCFLYEMTDQSGQEVECVKEYADPVGSLSLRLLNDGLDFIFSPYDEIGFFSGGSIKSVSCPLAGYLWHSGIGSFDDVMIPAGLTNNGAIGISFATAIAMIVDGKATITNLANAQEPGGGTIGRLGGVMMNDNGVFLVPYLRRESVGTSTIDGLLLAQGGTLTPVAFRGMVAPGGRKFQALSGWIANSVAINNGEQVVFGAQLDDGSGGIFRRNADGTFAVLTQDGVTNFVEGVNLSINQKGEVAARIFRSLFNPDQTSEILFFNSAGSPSRVVGSGDPAPGGTTFRRVDAPHLTDDTKIVFWAQLSDGRSGIFVASGLETEFVDPVPDLLVGSAIASDPSLRPLLATEGRPVEGIAADGVAQVVVRLKTGEPGTVDLSLVDANGTALPASNLNGSLSPVGQEAGAATASVPAADVQGMGPMAFAAYHAPTDFSGGPASAEANLADRTVFIKAKLTTSTGETIESTKPLTIIRPPVVLVHGLWNNRTTWDFFGGLSPRSPDPRFQIFTVDYPGTDAFAPSADVTLAQLADIVGDFKKGTNPAGTSVAAIQGDTVAHSMGGNVTRTMVTKAESGRDDNFHKGDIHRLITIDSPHLGSHLANRLVDSNIICRLVFWLSGHPVAGAVQDLAVGSSALQSLQEPLSSGLPTHVLVGIASSAQEQSAQENFQTFAFGLAQLICPSLLPAGGFQEIFGGPNDLLVSAASQAATGLSISGGSPPATISNGIIHGVIPGLFTLGPDSLSRDLIDGQPTEVPTPNPQRVIDLLNQPMTGASFAPIRP